MHLVPSRNFLYEVFVKIFIKVLNYLQKNDIIVKSKITKKKGRLQMKLNIRLIALLLSLVTVLGMFASCNISGGEQTSEITDQSTEAPAVTDEATSATDVAKTYDIIVNSEAMATIIRPKDLKAEDAPVAAAVKIRNNIESLVNVKFKMADDFKKASEEFDASTLEILVGPTAHPQVAEAIAGLNYGQYTIKAIGNKIVIFGFTDNALSAAANEFAKIVKEYATETADGKATVSIPAEALNIVVDHRSSSIYAAVPVFEGATFSATYETNTDVDEIILEDVTVEEYNAYVTKLENSGFTKYTSNDMSGNLFTTLYNKDYTLNVGYYKPFDECRIVMEPFSEKTLIGLESDNKYTAVTTSQITLVGCEYTDSKGSNVGNGLCMIFRLADGSFVIIDGSFNRATNANNIVNIITEQAKEYATGKDIRIAAWFISHSHGDHNGTLNGQASAFKKFTVERVIANFMTDAERERSMGSSYSGNWSSGEGGGDDATRNAAAALGADFIACHVGQRFYFADTVFEILYTVESYGPTVVNALNTSTILVRAITTDKNGKSSTTMVMGDVTGPAMAICNKMYGNDMRSEIVQVAHHGYTTWGNDSAMATAYKYMSPEIVLWPQGTAAFPTYKEKSYNKVLWDGTNKNFQQLYVAGWNNTQYIVPLPYSGDPASIISKVTTK